MKCACSALALVFFVALLFTVKAEQINGAGATFPAPIYQRWFQEYNKSHPEVQVNYQAIGSGGGIKQFTSGTLDFGASDAAMSDDQMAKIPSGVVLLPLTAGSIVLAYNLPGIGKIKLSRAAYAGIFLGSVTKWNDRSIVNNNPGVELPNMPITVVYRSDGSGTTFVFSKHLCAINSFFKSRVGGEGMHISWPVGLGGKGNDGVTALIKRTPGAIGYVEYGYAKQNGISMAELQNKSGKYVAPSLESGASTLASVQLPENLRIWPEDPLGENDYPIVTFSWVLVNKTAPNKAKWESLKKVLLYTLSDGQKLAAELGYIPLPKSVVEKVKVAINEVK